VFATAVAIQRTLRRVNMDFHDLAARLTNTEVPFKAKQPLARDEADFLGMVNWLQEHVPNKLAENQAVFIANVAGILTKGRVLSLRQANWLRDLYETHAMRNGGYPWATH
jgi:hypothetical protein